MVSKKLEFSPILNESCEVLEHESGLRIYICKKKDFKSSYAVFGTKYGSVDNGFIVDSKPVVIPEGTAHFLEHKLFESEDGDAFSRFSETGAYANAYTSFDRTCYLFSCSGRFYDNLEILLDFVTHPYFTAKTVEKEQGIIGQEIRMYDDSASWRVLFNMLEAMYEKHPVKTDIAGTVESIAKITDVTLYDCYKTFYDPSNMFLCIAGDVDSEKIIEAVNKAIPMSRGISFKRPEINEPEGIIKSEVTQSLEVGLPMFCLGFKERCCEGAERSSYEVLASEMLIELISGEISPLYKALTNEGLINDEFSGEYFTGRGYAVTMFSGESREPKTVRNRVVAEIKKFKENGIDREHFEAIRRTMYGSMIRQFNSVSSIGSLLVSCAVNNDSVFEGFDILRNMTVEDVERRLELLEEDKMVLSVIDKKEN